MLSLAAGEGENRKLMMSPHLQNVESPISSISQTSILELPVQNQKESSLSLPPSTASSQESKVQTPPVRSDLREVQRSSVPSGPNGDPPLDNHHFGLSYPLIALVCGGLVLFVITTCTIAFWCAKKKTKQKKQPAHNMQYYADTSGTDYYIDGASPKWGSQESIDPSGGSWFQPPQLMTTTEMSTGFSGPHAPPLPPPSPARALGYNKSTFTFDELSVATNGFAEANLLGQGGFGYVHKGVLPTGKEIAVKSLKAGSGQGEREFQAEVDIISRVHHRHLVSLVGYCIAAEKRLLIYDFLPNKTLEYHLHGKSPPIDWSTRLKIALGSAKGLAYLHEDCHPRIIHRDIKAANILLDLKFEALVADFGLAKLSSDNHTHISTRVMGTFGYLAPEYASSGKLTEKSDVFSYGVMLLELITGRRPCESSHTFMDDSLVDWARPILSRSLSNGNYDELVDQRLNGNYDPMEMARMVACAAAAVRHSARRRPKMSQIVRALDGDILLEDLNEGMRPGQSMLFSSGSDFENDIYTPAMRRSMRKLPVASPDYSDDFSDSMGNFVHRRANSASSDEVFSDEMSPIGIPRLGRSPF